MSNNIVKIFDTTLRDGEQSPGASMNIEQKIQIALQLQKLGVDIIEAGFATSSPGDFEAIENISKVVDKSIVCSLARALEKDIQQAAKAINSAKLKRIHTFIATSPIHMEHKLKMTPNQVIKKAVESVEYAKSFTDDVEFSCEDAARSDMVFLQEIIEAVIEAGATTINIPDTVGYRTPGEMAKMIKEIYSFVGDKITISVHCHNDLGLATANSLASVESGARQIECTINGLGERAGNASLEEIVMILNTRKDYYGDLKTNINTKELYPSSILVATTTGITPQPNKAIVGKNAFAHESGIHQDGVLKNPETYEIIKAEDVGISNVNSIVLGKLSGRAAFKEKILSLGYSVSDDELTKAFNRFKILADKKREIFDDDIRAIVTNEILKVPQTYELYSLQLQDCSKGVATSAVSIKFKDKIIQESAIGKGTIDSIFKAIDRTSGIEGQLVEYQVNSVTRGKDALAKVTVKVMFEDSKPLLSGQGLNIDTMSASADAYMSALNSYLYSKGE
jgi:2-isopropylmalate synthase